MTSVDFANAPPPTVIDGRLAVAMHIQDLRAVVTMDAARSSGQVEATMTYAVGPVSGLPIFDLRQTVRSCRLDGVAIDPSRIAARDVGAGPASTVRIIDVVQQAGSVHRLSTSYRLAMPAADLGGGYPPVLTWSAGPRLRWSFAMSDLSAGRYLEAWFPSNLPFDQFPATLEIRIVGTPIAHAVITNGDVTVVGANWWSIRFPASFTTMSALLEIRPADAVRSRTATVGLPASRRTITVQAWKLAGGPEDLPVRIAQIASLLQTNEREFGPYPGDRFVGFFHGAPGGMEYNQATTTSASALRHETFHSWFGRGISPASPADGWWDEAFTQFHEDGPDLGEPFDFAMPPVVLCSRRPFQRTTPRSSYTAGSRFFRGLAASVGPARLRDGMRGLYAARWGTPVSTAALEGYLVGTTCDASVVDAFHRFVYGFAEPAPDQRLEFADPGPRYRESPSLWVRTSDDGETSAQPPLSGRDNWIHARVRNRSAGGSCSHYVVVFAVRASRTTPFLYPGDFFPAVATVVGFDLEHGATRTVSARWPSARLAARGTRLSVLASIHARRDHPTSGTHVWEQVSTAQRDVTVS
jgi:hypothetical protein